MQPGPAGSYPDLPTCFRHPNRPTGLRCTRCERPACPECLREAAVGYQCVDCVAAGRRDIRVPRTIAGARLQTKPVVVPLLIGLNLGVFAITVAQANSLGRNDLAPLFNAWVTWPREIVGDNEWWRLFTGGFLHYGPVHIALNMFALWLIGRDVEPLLGRARFITVYLLSLLGGSAAVFAFGNIDTGLAGASGAVWGVMGAVLVAVLRLKLNPQPILAVIAINVFISFLPGISLLGHLGGFVVGTAATAAMVYAPRQQRVPIQAGAIAGLTVLLTLIIALRAAQISTVIGA